MDAIQSAGVNEWTKRMNTVFALQAYICLFQQDKKRHLNDGGV